MSRFLWVLFSFDGRISRKTYWLASLSLFLISIAVSFAGVLLDKLFGTPTIEGLSFFLGRRPIEVALSFAMLYPGFAVLVKRLHDRNKGARWIALTLIPIIGTIWIVVDTGFFRGTVGPNDWGDDPLARSGSNDPDLQPSNAA